MRTDKRKAKRKSERKASAWRFIGRGHRFYVCAPFSVTFIYSFSPISNIYNSTPYRMALQKPKTQLSRGLVKAEHAAASHHSRAAPGDRTSVHRSVVMVCSLYHRSRRQTSCTTSCGENSLLGGNGIKQFAAADIAPTVVLFASPALPHRLLDHIEDQRVRTRSDSTRPPRMHVLPCSSSLFRPFSRLLSRASQADDRRPQDPEKVQVGLHQGRVFC